MAAEGNKGRTVEIKIGGSMLDDIGRLKTKKGVEETASHTIYVKSIPHLCSILSARKLSLMAFIAEHAGANVGKISVGLNRKKEAVSRDLRILREAGLVKLKKKGRDVCPEVACDYLKIPIRG